MRSVLRAFGAGVRAVVTAPVLLIAVTLTTMLAAVPFGVVLESQLREALAHRQPVYLGTAEIDAEWWLEFREHAEGMAATFTPAIIGFAAPLSNLSAILDGTSQPLVLLGPIVLAGVVWAWLWGGWIARLRAGRGLGPRAFFRAGRQHVVAFTAISLAAAATQLVLYLTVHAVLFGPVFEWITAMVATERAAFFWRVALYAVFGACLIAVSLAADYARISVVVERRAVTPAIATSLAFLRAHGGQAVAVYLLIGVLFVALMTLYGTAEVVGGTRLGGWRSILIGQGFIMGRLALRLLQGAAAVSLFGQYQRPDAPVS